MVKRGNQSESGDSTEQNGDLDGSEDGYSTGAPEGSGGSGTVTPKDDGTPPLKGGKASRAETTVAGGRRRKAVRKR